jgi:hypothetical protein
MSGPDPWLPAEPVPLRPVPAADVRGLRGRRIIIGMPGQGWRYDHRADDPVTNDGETFVPALLEADYYRAELDQIEVFAPLVPIAQVWVEQLNASATHHPPPSPTLIEDELTRHPPPPHSDNLLSRLVSLTAPPERHPTPARDVTALTGRRVILASPTHEQRDLRAATEPYQNPDGDICVRICDESRWYQWAFTGRPPTCTEVPVYLLWAE